jgi:hypothetical protein
MATTPQYNFTVNLDDLSFILKQIKIAEASTNPVTGAAENLPKLVGSPLLPYGLRTVDGSWNNLMPGMERAGAADNIMPRLVPGAFIPAEARPPGFDGPDDPGGAATSYAQSAPGNIVYDARPRATRRPSRRPRPGRRKASIRDRTRSTPRPTAAFSFPTCRPTSGCRRPSMA